MTIDFESIERHLETADNNVNESNSEMQDTLATDIRVLLAEVMRLTEALHLDDAVAVKASVNAVELPYYWWHRKSAGNP